MISNITIYCISSLLFLNLVGGKPVSSLQSLKELLEEESNAPYLDSEEAEVQGKEMNAENAAFTKASLHSWDPNSRDAALSSNENALVRLLNDILSSSKRSWSRFKKGGLRSCFGVRLERIGSFSGLGC
uniref:C-type natriuretic peptide-3 n=1 Tax=Anguilla japonica TaxID=7937 RepID=D2KXA3_ANGJA|nr:C-type natriuretic peptide-3 [Anguilla japonica]